MYNDFLSMKEIEEIKVIDLNNLDLREKKCLFAFAKSMNINNYPFSFKNYEKGKICIYKENKKWQSCYVSEDGIIMDLRFYNNPFDLCINIYNKLIYVNHKCLADYLNVLKKEYDLEDIKEYLNQIVENNSVKRKIR